MKARDFHPRRLDVRAFAEAAGALQGQVPVADFARLGTSLAAAGPGPVTGAVQWSARGVQVAVRGDAAQSWLHLHLEAALPLTCQRCLQPCIHPVALDRQFLFVADEAKAQRLDAEIEHDVLVLTRELDLHELLEDELLLDLPLVPRHERCAEPLPGTAMEDRQAETPHPFAALAALRRGTH